MGRRKLKEQFEALALALTTLLSATGCSVTVDGHNIEFSTEELINGVEEFLGKYTSDEKGKESDDTKQETTITTTYVAETTQTSTYTTIVGSIAQPTQTT